MADSKVHVALMIDETDHDAIVALARHQGVSYGEALISALQTGLAAKEMPAKKPVKGDGEASKP